MSRSRNLDRMMRYQWFESGFLQRRVHCEPGSQEMGDSRISLAATRPFNDIPHRNGASVDVGPTERHHASPARQNGNAKRGRQRPRRTMFRGLMLRNPQRRDGGRGRSAGAIQVSPRIATGTQSRGLLSGSTHRRPWRSLPTQHKRRNVPAGLENPSAPCLPPATATENPGLRRKPM